MAWYKSDQWRKALEATESWWHSAVTFVYDECQSPPPKGFGSWLLDIVDACDDLATHIDPTPIWELHSAIDKFHARVAGPLPPHYRPLPSLRKMYLLMDRAHLAVYRLKRAGVTNKEPVDPEDAKRLLVDTLTPTQDAIFRALTDEFQPNDDIAEAARIDPDEVRRQLPNLKRLGLAQNERGKGYRRI
jgi:hypothetical protein